MKNQKKIFEESERDVVCLKNERRMEKINKLNLLLYGWAEF
jgi:hypothetical protein